MSRICPQVLASPRPPWMQKVLVAARELLQTRSANIFMSNRVAANNSIMALIVVLYQLIVLYQ